MKPTPVKPPGFGVHLSPQRDFDDTVPRSSTNGVAGFTRVSRVPGGMDQTGNPSAFFSLRATRAGRVSRGPTARGCRCAHQGERAKREVPKPSKAAYGALVAPAPSPCHSPAALGTLTDTRPVTLPLGRVPGRNGHYTQ